LVKSSIYSKIKPLVDTTELYGSSPPSVFVGRIGYPKVLVGPMIPPIKGDTSIIDTPELWIDKSIYDIISFRSQLVRGTYLVNVYDVENPNKIVEFTRELALSENPTLSEAVFEKKPYGKIAFYDDAQPHGPTAPLKKLDISNPKYDRRIEKAFYDTDLRARDAIIQLYKDNTPISRIQRAFSVGAFGEKSYRRFVPTRWSITAVDSIIGEDLIKNTKSYPLINKFRVYFHNQYDNRWIVLMMPTEWKYELIEAWYPKTTWNPFGASVRLFNSYEFYRGRKGYAEIGGCYYAARLAVNEKLNTEKRQAGVVVMREAHPGYILPIGVWNVRESVRKTLRQEPMNFDNLKEALSFISKKLDIPIERWVNNSAIIKDVIHQKRIEDFVKT
jgi:hypothetical protein